MGFDFPWGFLLLIVIAPIIWVLRRSEVQTKNIIYSFKDNPPSRRYFVLRCILISLFMGSLVVIVTGPYIVPKVSGDYMFLVDTSRSMQARNSCGEPTFFERAKDIVRDVMAGVPEGRFGIVAFDRLAFPITNMTYDHAYLEDVLKHGLFIGMTYRATQTNIGNALSVVATKKQTLPELFGNVRYIILLSDGYLDNDDWRKDLEQPFQKLQQSNIKVVSVGIGNAVETPIPIIASDGCRSEFFEVNGETVRIPFRSDVLKLIASETQGEYFGEGQNDELVNFIRQETFTDVSEEVNFRENQRNSISWIFLLSATIALFGFLILRG